MNELYPLKFKPIFKEKIWGGTKIKTQLKLDYSPLVNCGEAWLLSGVFGEESKVTNGCFEENEINELIETFMGDLVGERVHDEYGGMFPLLIKILDTNDYLSVQVHPDDELAKKRGYEYGKTEMWYILEAEKNAEIIYGLKEPISKMEYIELLKNKKLGDFLHFEKVKKDDAIFVPAGKIHATGPDILLIEVQQTSDVTYRIHDWDRIGVDGLPARDLHISESVDAINFDDNERHITQPKQEINKTNKIIDCEYFTSNIINIDQTLKKDFSELDSFVIYICMEGKVDIESKGQLFEIIAGETILIPNCINEIQLIAREKSKLMEVYLAYSSIA